MTAVFGGLQLSQPDRSLRKTGKFRHSGRVVEGIAQVSSSAVLFRI